MRTIDRALDRAILVSWMVLLWSLAFAPFAQVRDVGAYHPHPDPFHLGTIHSSGQNEDFCSLVYDGSIAQATVQARVKATLYQDNPSEDWDGLSSNKLWFIPYDSSCDSYGQATRDQIEIEYRVRDGGSSVCAPPPGPPYTACVDMRGPYWNGSVGHTDYYWGNAYFRTNHFTQGSGLYHHAVNHETGHILGLKDPDYNGHCMDNISVMHSIFYSCTLNREWPTWNDHNTVVLLAN